jgi:hypothetical protein
VLPTASCVRTPPFPAVEAVIDVIDRGYSRNLAYSRPEVKIEASARTGWSAGRRSDRAG